MSKYSMKTIRAARSRAQKAVLTFISYSRDKKSAMASLKNGKTSLTIHLKKVPGGGGAWVDAYGVRYKQG